MMNVTAGRFALAALCAVLALAALANETPELRFEKIIGDARGRSVDNLSVAAADDGSVYLLMNSGRVAVFDAQGSYVKSLETSLTWPFDHAYLSVQGKLVLVGDCKEDYPWVYSARRGGATEGAFGNPGMVTEDEAGNVYVADAGNKRIQIFPPGDHAKPSAVVAMAAKPIVVAVLWTLLAAATDDGTLSVFEKKAGAFVLLASLKVGRAKSICLGADGALFIAFHDSLRKYSILREPHAVLKESAVIAPSWMERWPNVFNWNVAMVPGPGGELYFPADRHGKLLSLDPATDQIRERGNLPGRTLAIGFAPDGTLFTATTQEKDGGAVIQKFKLGEKTVESLGLFTSEPFYKEKNVPVWGLLPDADGGVFVRVLEEGHNKGWTALTIKKVFEKAPMKLYHDFGHLYAKRTTFHPAAATYSMKFTADRAIVMTAMALVAVYKIAPDGAIIWEAGLEPKGGADTVEFGSPRDIATDSQGRVWVTDAAKDKIVCLSSTGTLLLEYGGHANVDDTEGKGFNGPSGIATAKVGDGEFLYVGDAGNQRIVKFRIR